MSENVSWHLHWQPLSRICMKFFYKHKFYKINSHVLNSAVYSIRNNSQPVQNFVSSCNSSSSYKEEVSEKSYHESSVYPSNLNSFESLLLLSLVYIFTTPSLLPDYELGCCLNLWSEVTSVHDLLTTLILFLEHFIRNHQRYKSWNYDSLFIIFIW